MSGGRERDVRADLALAAVAAVLGAVIVLASAGAGFVDLPWGFVAGAQVVGVALAAAARRHPLAGFWTSLAISVAVPLGATPVAAYALGRWRTPARATNAAAIGGVVALWGLWLVQDRAPDVDRVLTYVTVTLLGGVAGAALRSAEASRVAQAAREEVERVSVAEAVRRGERDRLAREMHDVVAHRISLMVLDANRIEAGSAPSATAVARQIRETGRGALDDMRDVLGRLRSDDLDDGLARHSFSEVRAVVDGVRAVGQPVELRLRAQSRQPPDLAERTAVRIVREALTNAARHAPGASTVVDVAESEGRVVVEVRNDPPSHAPSVTLTTGGHGLTGMRERVELVGGVLTTGPSDAGGFVVRAVLPRGDR
jgi:signal transduction histidine kinase